MSFDQYVRKSVIGYAGPALERRHVRHHEGKSYPAWRLAAEALRRVREEPWTPAATLMFAVYEQALRDAFHGDAMSRDQQEAARFVLTGRCHDLLWSLDIDPEYAQTVLAEAFEGSVPMAERVAA